MLGAQPKCFHLVAQVEHVVCTWKKLCLNLGGSPYSIPGHVKPPIAYMEERVIVSVCTAALTDIRSESRQTTFSTPSSSRMSADIAQRNSSIERVYFLLGILVALM